MINDTQVLNNGYPMPKVGLGVYKMEDDEMETAVQTALKRDIVHLILLILR